MEQDLIKVITNKIFDLIVQEIQKETMKEAIRLKVVNPLMTMIYKQLYPYILSFVVFLFIMFGMVLFLMIAFILYLKKE